MEPTEPDTHSFIIKIWLEEKAEETGRVLWRGHITHVSSGTRRYMQDLKVIPQFVGQYLEELGVISDSADLEETT